MEKKDTCWFSPNLQRDMSVRVYGHAGLPLLIFPTQDAMSDNFENFGMIDTLANDIDSGRIQLFCVDTVDVETWSNVWGDKVWRASRQESYYNYIIEEVLPMIREKNSSEKLPIAAGCSLGGLHAEIVFLRRFLRLHLFLQIKLFTVLFVSLLTVVLHGQHGQNQLYYK